MVDDLLADTSSETLTLRRLRADDFDKGYCGLVSNLTQIGDLTAEKFVGED